MKKIKLYITIFTLGLIIYGCDKPAPTELVQDSQSAEDPASVEVITKDINDDTNSNGFDSTGVTDDLSKFSNVVAVSGTKVTSGSSTFNSSLALAVFFDKSKPVFSPDGKRIGFAARVLGNVEFDGNKARLLPYIKRYRYNNASADTALGLFHYLYSGRRNQIDPFRFKYNSEIKFKLNPIIGNTVEFNIPTPPEITGTVKLQVNKNNNRKKIIVEWNAFPSSKLEIIIGAAARGRDKILPIYKIRTRDDGRFEIPSNLINSLPSDRFDRLTISLIRKYEGHHSENGNDIYVLSQSVHTIIIGNP